MEIRCYNTPPQSFTDDLKKDIEEANIIKFPLLNLYNECLQDK